MIKFILFFGFAILLLFPLLIAIGSALVFGLWRAMTYETRFRRFNGKYGNEEIARMAASGKIWTGQTAEQLKDAKGEPLRIESHNGEDIWIYRSNPLTKTPLRVTITENRVQNWTA